MICYMPEIYEDETVYSWFCRYYVHSGYPYYKYALDDLFVKLEGCLVADLEFIGNLNEDAKAVISSIYPMEELIFKHTTFPQYARFADRERRNKGFKTLIESRGSIRNTLPMPMNKSGARYVCYCPLCAQEDRETYGEAYWHRSYFIRGIGICVKHMCRLINTSIKISRVMPPRLLVADNVIPYEDTPEFVEDAKQTAFAQYLSLLKNQYSIYLLALFWRPLLYRRGKGRCRTSLFPFNFQDTIDVLRRFQIIEYAFHYRQAVRY